MAEDNKIIELIAKLSIDKASQVFSKMIKAGSKIVFERAYSVSIVEITEKINAENRNVMSAFVDLVGDAPFKFLFYTDEAKGKELTELILQRKLDNVISADMYISSAIQEIGNIMASAVCNIFSNDFQIQMKPTPPVVAHDFLGAIFQQGILEIAMQRDEVFVIETNFNIVNHDIKCNIFIMPLPGSEDKLNKIYDQVKF